MNIVQPIYNTFIPKLHISFSSSYYRGFSVGFSGQSKQVSFNTNEIHTIKTNGNVKYTSNYKTVLMNNKLEIKAIGIKSETM